MLTCLHNQIPFIPILKRVGTDWFESCRTGCLYLHSVAHMYTIGGLVIQCGISQIRGEEALHLFPIHKK